jgi:hypothetical protein
MRENSALGGWVASSGGAEECQTCQAHATTLFLTRIRSCSGTEVVDGTIGETDEQRVIREESQTADRRWKGESVLGHWRRYDTAAQASQVQRCCSRVRRQKSRVHIRKQYSTYLRQSPRRWKDLLQNSRHSFGTPTEFDIRGNSHLMPVNRNRKTENER